MKVKKLKPGKTEFLFDSTISASQKKKSTKLTKQIKSLEKKIADLYKEIDKTHENKKSLKKQLNTLDNSKIVTPELIKFIKKNCSEFLKIATKANAFLYRGFGGSFSDTHKRAFIGMPRENRKPKDSYQNLQDQLDEYLTEKGFTALRSNSLFVTGSKTATSTYGSMYVIFPLNGYKFTWSQVEDDLILNDSYNYDKPKWPKAIDALSDKIWDRIDYLELKLESATKPETKLQLRKAIKLLSRFETKVHNLTMSAKSTTVKSNWDKVKKEIAELKKNNIKIPGVNYTIFNKLSELSYNKFDDLKFDCKDLVRAIKKKHEIYLYGQYLAVPAFYQYNGKDFSENVNLLAKEFLKKK